MLDICWTQPQLQKFYFLHWRDTCSRTQKLYIAQHLEKFISQLIKKLTFAKVEWLCIIWHLNIELWTDRSLHNLAQWREINNYKGQLLNLFKGSEEKACGTWQLKFSSPPSISAFIYALSPGLLCSSVPIKGLARSMLYNVKLSSY